MSVLAPVIGHLLVCSPFVLLKPLYAYTEHIFSGRSPAASGSKKHKSEEEADDLTKEMEEPPPEPNIQEVTVPKPGMLILNYSNHRNIGC